MKNLFMRIKAIILVFALFISVSLFAGCTYRGYNGDYPELYSVAWSNIPNISGFMSNGEVLYDAAVEILEIDDYGRILFSYSEDMYGNSRYILIMQRADSERAYYYPDDCYVYVCPETTALNLDLSEIIELKHINDWNKPLDESKCEGTEIVRKKPEGKLKVKDSYFENIIREYHESSDRYVHPKNISFVRFFEFSMSDDYGRELYVVYTDFNEYNEKTEIAYEFVFLVIVNPDKSYDPSTVVLLENATSPQEAMKTIKTQNNWNTDFD